MQYVYAESLQALIDREWSRQLRGIQRIGTQEVADGLSAMHQQSLVHRGVKPFNTLLEKDVDRALIETFLSVIKARVIDGGIPIQTGSKLLHQKNHHSCR